MPPLNESSRPSSYAPAPTAPARPVPFPADAFVDWDERRATGAPAPTRPVCESAEFPPAEDVTDPGRRARRYWSCREDSRRKGSAPLAHLPAPGCRCPWQVALCVSRTSSANRTLRGERGEEGPSSLTPCRRLAASPAHHCSAWPAAPVLTLLRPKQSPWLQQSGAEGARPRQATPPRRTRPPVLPLAGARSHASGRVGNRLTSPMDAGSSWLRKGSCVAAAEGFAGHILATLGVKGERRCGVF